MSAVNISAWIEQLESVVADLETANAVNPNPRKKREANDHLDHASRQIKAAWLTDDKSHAERCLTEARSFIGFARDLIFGSRRGS